MEDETRCSKKWKMRQDVVGNGKMRQVIVRNGRWDKM